MLGHFGSAGLGSFPLHVVCIAGRRLRAGCGADQLGVQGAEVFGD